MGIPIRYEIEIAGAAQMRRIQRSIEKETVQGAKNGAVAQAAAEKKAQKAKTQTATAAQRAAQKELRFKEQIERRKIAIQNRSFAMEQRMRERAERDAIRSERRKAQAAIREAKRAQAARERLARNMSSGVLGVGRGIVGGAARVGGAIMGLGAGLAVTSAVRKRMDVSQRASELANRAAVVPGETRSREEIFGKIMSRTRELSDVSGRGQDVLLAGLNRFVEKSGQMNSGQALLESLSDFADAVGIRDDEFEELGKAAGIVLAGFEAQGTKGKEAVSKTDSVLRSIAKQSAIGQIGVADIVTELPKIIAAASRITGDQAQNIATITALANISTAVASKGPEEATTAAVRFTDDLIKKRKKFKKRGIDVFSDDGSLRDPREIITELAVKTKGSLPDLTELFGMRGVRLAEFASNISRQESDPDVARKKIRAEIDKFLGESLTDKDIQKGKEFVRGSDARQTARQMQQLERAIADDFVPVFINDLLPALKEMAPLIKDASSGFASFVSWFANNPIQGVGALVLAKIGASITNAGIGAGVERSIAASMKGGNMATAMSSAMAGLAISTVILSAGIVNFKKLEGEAARFGKDVVDAKSGKLSPEQIAEKRRELNKALTAEKSPGIVETGAQKVLSFVRGEGFMDSFAPEEAEKVRKQNSDMARQFAEFTTARSPSHINTLKGMDAQLAEAQRKAIQEQMIAAKEQREAAAEMKQAAGAVKGDPRRNDPIGKRN